MKDQSRSQPILLAHLVWMPKYNGELVGLHPGTWKHPEGRDPSQWHERWNFSPQGGYCYGSCFHWDRKNNKFLPLSIERLDASDSDRSVRGVTVIFTAKHPESKRRVVVGWYKNAEVFRNAQPGKTKGRDYLFRARARDVTCLSYRQRTKVVGTAQSKGPNHPGRDPAFYVSDNNPALALSLRKYLASRPEKQQPQSKKPPRTQDPERRAEVEERAMKAVEAHLEAQEWDVERVHWRKLGWDLEATLGKQRLLIEVKGTSSNSLAAELTPNEWDKMHKHRTGRNNSKSAIAIVRNVLSQPDVRVFFWNHDAWIDEQWEHRLKIKLRLGAVVSGVEQ